MKESSPPLTCHMLRVMCDVSCITCDRSRRLVSPVCGIFYKRSLRRKNIGLSVHFANHVCIFGLFWGRLGRCVEKLEVYSGEWSPSGSPKAKTRGTSQGTPFTMIHPRLFHTFTFFCHPGPVKRDFLHCRQP